MQPGGGAAYSISAGHSIAVVPFEGPLITVWAIGTATHSIDENELVAFGHPMNWYGAPKYAMAVKPARVAQFVEDPVRGNFKLAVPVGEIGGGITQDRNYGILVDRNAEVDRVEIVVNIKGQTTTHWVAHVDDPYLQSYFVINGLYGIVQMMIDSSMPGIYRTRVAITRKNDRTVTIDLGETDWTNNGVSSVWGAISSEFDNIKRLEISLD